MSQAIAPQMFFTRFFPNSWRLTARPSHSANLRIVRAPISCALLLLALPRVAGAQWNPLNPVTGVKKDAAGVTLSEKVGTLRLQVESDSIVRVTYTVAAIPPGTRQFMITRENWPPVEWAMQSNEKEITLSTARLKVTVTRNDGAILFSDSSGKKLFQDYDRSLVPVQVNGEKTYHSEMFSNLWDSTEAFYGLGQHQAGVWNYHGEDVELSQDNTNISIPMFLSSNGYGIFWNNASRSRFNNRFPHALYLSSEVADSVDYYFMYGPEFDKIIADYRDMTGAAPLFGKWAYGFWQCKNKYESQGEILGVAHKYRELRIPVDNIVQDWFWWRTMGEPVFNKNYPDPAGMIGDLHKNNFHVMFSFWPYFRPGSAVYEEMDKRGFFIDRTKAAGFHPAGQALYDAFNPEARKYYWQLIDRGLFKIGADAWWLDTDEPETEGRETSVLVNNKVAIGGGAQYANLFSLMTTQAVYEGQRAASNDKRVFILSRSAAAGTQRNSVAAWSGDVESNWLSFARQIPAGLNFSLSGIPYWTTDIGGFIIGNPDDPAYRELFIRWFEYGTFCPIFRLHGTRTTNTNELWSYGEQAQKILTDYDRLRYRLMPYIYSLAWKTTREGYTLMRPLAMDFRSDVRAQNIGDQFMFGPALLVNPVTEPGATKRHLYLPRGAWRDFWTGRKVDGGNAIDASANLERMPLYVRAGSIIPMGPELLFATEKPADPVELRIYQGADGDFLLYEDQNDNYNYEKGAYATIEMHWDDSKKILTLADRWGKFTGMLQNRTFKIVVVREDVGVGIETTTLPDIVIQYSGKQLSVNTAHAAATAPLN
ncbi:MAG: glycoside hydrolase family 31 protein [Acidobacteriota bacterium]|nr:glycoside hydrolase family 31 protein [Acidobacteriota bacterium]